MRAADFFAAIEQLPIGSLAEVTRGGGLVIVAPHPDDESLGCGGLIAKACAGGVAVRLVVVSDGIGSHPSSARYPASRLRALREAETRAAVAHLGLRAEAIRFLALPDRGVPIEGPDANAARDAIAAAVRDIAAGAVCVTWRHDPHCDHQATAALVDGAELGGARKLFYSVWGWTLPPDAEVDARPHGLRLDVARHRGAKAAAIAAHRSQTTDLIDDDPNGFRLPPEMIERCLGRYETLIEEAR